MKLNDKITFTFKHKRDGDSFTQDWSLAELLTGVGETRQPVSQLIDAFKQDGYELVEDNPAESLEPIEKAKQAARARGYKTDAEAPHLESWATIFEVEKEGQIFDCLYDQMQGKWVIISKRGLQVPDSVIETLELN